MTTGRFFTVRRFSLTLIVGAIHESPETWVKPFGSWADVVIRPYGRWFAALPIVGAVDHNGPYNG